METTRTIPEIVADVMRQASTLMRAEAGLARAEISESLDAVTSGLGMIIGGAMLIIPGLVLGLQACAAAVMAAGLADSWSLAIFGGGALIIGIVLAMVGRQRMKASKLKPSKTIDELSRDVAMAKQQMGQTHATQRAA
ncbi:MAG: phage holin family protein [Methylocystis sp.]|jgi:membrane protein implicated in regulation of membrane protease activity